MARARRRNLDDGATTGGRDASASNRMRLAVSLALATLAALCTVFVVAGNNAFLMPGPLHSVHGSIDDCRMCHTKSGTGKLSWLHGLVADNALDDSMACLSCHKMPDTAFNAHGATADVLNESNERLARYAARTTGVPTSALAQSVALPTRRMMAGGLNCATCHQEHQGAQFDMKQISDTQCRSCHVVKFDSFDGQHPEFGTYPFKRRTRIIYDHAGHFSKHYPEVAAKDPSRRVPQDCTSCHDSNGDRRVMAAAPFDKTCSSCHLDQITGAQRATGPKGIAFLALPGVDLETLRKRNSAVGEWPEDTEAPLTPFMQVMISRSARGQALVKAVADLDLQDLSAANDKQIKAVTDLVLEIKSLLFALISGKASDIFGKLKLATGATPSADVIASLTAGLPRDVLLATQQRYLPNLAAEIANGPGATGQPPATQVSAPAAAPEATAPAQPATAAVPEQPADPPASTEATPASDEEPATEVASDESDSPEASETPADVIEPPQPNQQTCLVRLLGQCMVFGEEPGKGDQLRAPQRLGGPKAVAGEPPRATVRRPKLPQTRPPAAAGQQRTAQVANTPQTSGGGAKDDLLFPSEQEKRAIDTHRKAAGRGKQVDNAPPAGARPPVAAAPASPAPATAAAAPAVPAVPPIGSDVDAESWAEYGGWYEQDHVIYYRPAGHKDRFIYTWLTLTGPLAPAGGKEPAAEVFDALTAKDAQGSCAKCHSVENGGRGRRINFTPLNARAKQGRFTRFVHEPHFGVVGKRGCITCHELKKGGSYLKSYEQGDPRRFNAEFGAVKIDSCQACHNSGMARQDCLLCHKYHVFDVVTPMPKTRLDPP